MIEVRGKGWVEKKKVVKTLTGELKIRDREQVVGGDSEHNQKPF